METQRPTVHFALLTGSKIWHQTQRILCWLVGCCFTSQQHACVPLRRVCSDNCTCCHTETEVADQTFYLTQSQYTDTGPTSPSAEPVSPGAWQGSHWSTVFKVTGFTRLRSIPLGKAGINTTQINSLGKSGNPTRLRSIPLGKAGIEPLSATVALTTRPTR